MFGSTKMIIDCECKILVNLQPAIIFLFHCISFSGLLIPQYFYVQPGEAERVPSDAGTTDGIFMWGQAVYFISQLLGNIGYCHKLPFYILQHLQVITIFSAILSKGNNFCDFLFVSLDNVALSK